MDMYMCTKSMWVHTPAAGLLHRRLSILQLAGDALL